jgi:ankyrin repeat protein
MRVLKGTLICKFFPKDQILSGQTQSQSIIHFMKLMLNFFILGIVILSFVSCGKKAEMNEKKSSDNLTPTLAEVHFKALKELKKSLSENNLAAVKKIIIENPGIDLNQTSSDSGETFLIISIKKDFRSIRNYLIEKGANLDLPNVNKETPLIAAVVHSQINSVKVLLDYKVDLEKKDMNGDTALHIALNNSNDEIALVLIRQGANIYSLDRKEKSPLKIAQENGLNQSIEALMTIMDLESGAPDLSTYRNIITQGDFKKLNYLLTRFPKIASDKIYQSINPLALLVEAKNEQNAIRSAEILLINKSNVNGPEEAEQTPLIRATVRQKKGFANLYLSSEANPQLLDKEGKSALIHAVQLNNSEMVDLLLSYSAVEKYTFRKDGKKITYNACTIAKEIALRLTTQSEKEANKRIRRSLDCGFFYWPI